MERTPVRSHESSEFSPDDFGLMPIPGEPLVLTEVLISGCCWASRLPSHEVRVLLLTNPRAGRGRGASASAPIARILNKRGHEVERRQVAGNSSDPLATDQLAQFDVILIAGGDGTIHHLLPALILAQRPIYHLPLGTENLFAREFAMTLKPERVADAVEAGWVESVDLGTCNDEPFALMCSLGPDANIVHRLVRRRGGPISHLSYLQPVLAEMARPGFAPMTVTVDGEQIVAGQPGFLVVANCRQYGFRLDPAAQASMTDGLLDVVFMPCRTSAGAIWWAARARLRSHLRAHHTIFRTGNTIEIKADDSLGRFQVDGEAGAAPAQDNQFSLKLGVLPRALQVLIPVHLERHETLRPSPHTGLDQPDSTSARPS